jgi:Uncharacterized protein conserved in bacteria
MALWFASKLQNQTLNRTTRYDIMSIEDRVKATAKNIEGKVQEAVGEVTGDPKDKVEGRAKQAEAKARHTTEDIKDEVKKAID